MTKRECFEKIAGCFFFNDQDKEALKDRRSRFDKMFGAKLPDEYLDFLWDWGLQLEAEFASENGKAKDLKAESDRKLAETIIAFSHEGNEPPLLMELRKLFVQRRTWKGWTLEKVNENNMELFVEYDNVFREDFPNKGRPQNAKPAIVAWKLYFVISFEEQDNAISLTNSKLATITDFIDFFQLYDYPDCNDRMNFEREAIKARMNYFRKKPDFERLQWYCNTLKKQFLDGDSSAIDSYSTCMLDMVELLHL